MTPSTQTPTLYIPSTSFSLSETPKPIFNLAIQARGGQGKTFSALSFPNVTVINFDNNLQLFAGRKDIYQVPFWKDEFVDSIIPRGSTLDTGAPKPPTVRPNRRDALMRWLNKEGYKFTSEQTLVFDSWSKMQDAFDQQESLEPRYTKQGSIDEFAFWRNKLDWSTELCELIGSLPCNKVTTFHEMYVTSEDGKIIFNKVVPLMQGKFVNKLSLYFSDWFRSWFFAKGTKVSSIPDALKGHFKGQEVEEDCGFWQTKSDLLADCKTRIRNCPTFIKADYKELIRLHDSKIEIIEQLKNKD